MSTSPAVDNLPVRLGDFEVTGLLGQGGSGVVYDARWGHREVALKVLHPSLVATGKEREQFFAEARRLAEIAHPGVVKVLSVGELADGRPYLAMEKLVGETLASRLARGSMTRGGAELALRLFGQLADAVGALHERGLVHRDLKPENVMLVGGPGVTDRAGDAEGSVGPQHAVLLDFGIAKDLAAPASTTTSDGGVRGTPAYMAPERFFGTPASIATDVYELAVVLFAMLAGRLPWDDCGDPEVRLNPLRLADLAPSLPAALDVEVARALSTRAANRPAGTRAFADAVRAAAGVEAVPGAIAAAPSGRLTAEVRPQATPPAGPAWFDAARAAPSGDLAVAPTVNARPARKSRAPWIVAGVAVAAGAAVTIALVATRHRGSDAAAADDPWAGPPGSPGAGDGSASASAATPTSPASTSAPVAPAPKVIPPPSDRPLRKELSAALGHFPHDTRAVVGLVVDEVRQDPDLARLIMSDARAKELGAMLDIAGCSIDFARATDWGLVGFGASAKTADAILSGRWSRDTIESCLGGAQRADIQHLVQDGVELTRLHGSAGDRWIGWIDDRTFFVTLRDDVDGAWTAARVRATDGPGGVIGELAPSLDRDAVGWAISDQAAMAGNDMVTVPAGDVIARVTLGNGVDARVRIRYADAAAAQAAHAAIDKQIDAAQSGLRELGVVSTADHEQFVDVRLTLARGLLHAVAIQPPK